MPLPKVTIRASPSSLVSTTKPGARRRWMAPTSRIAVPDVLGARLDQDFLVDGGHGSFLLCACSAASSSCGRNRLRGDSRRDRPRRRRSSWRRSRRAGRACRCRVRPRAAPRRGRRRRSCGSAHRSRHAGRICRRPGRGARRRRSTAPRDPGRSRASPAIRSGTCSRAVSGCVVEALGLGDVANADRDVIEHGGLLCSWNRATLALCASENLAKIAFPRPAGTGSTCESVAPPQQPCGERGPRHAARR